MSRYAVLLRGINVGRANQIVMADLRALLVDEGYTNVATLLRSGTIVLDTPVPAAQLRPAIERALRQRFGIAIDAVVRRSDELLRILAKDPFRDVVTDDSRYLVLAAGARATGPRIIAAMRNWNTVRKLAALL